MPLFLILALASCGGNDPVADKGVSPPDNMVGDAPSAGLATPANAAAAEAKDAAATPPPTDGMAWQVDSARRIARYGPSGGDMAAMPLAIDCAVPGTMRLLRGEAPSSGKATMSFTGNGHVASIEVAASGSTYLGVARGDTLRGIARTFDGPAPVEATVGDAGDLRLPATPDIRRFLATCARG